MNIQMKSFLVRFSMTISATQFSFFVPRLSFTENTYLKLEVHVSLACFSPSWWALSMKRRICGNKERQEREKRRVVSNKVCCFHEVLWRLNSSKPWSVVCVKHLNLILIFGPIYIQACISFDILVFRSPSD